MLTLAEIRENLKDRNLSYVAESIGRSRQQVWQVASGKNTNPTYSFVKQLSDYLQSDNDPAP